MSAGRTRYPWVPGTLWPCDCAWSLTTSPGGFWHTGSLLGTLPRQTGQPHSGRVCPEVTLGQLGQMDTVMSRCLGLSTLSVMHTCLWEHISPSHWSPTQSSSLWGPAVLGAWPCRGQSPWSPALLSVCLPHKPCQAGCRSGPPPCSLAVPAPGACWPVLTRGAALPCSPCSPGPLLPWG